jgi:2-keto-4-pentenoate hydratase
MSLDNPEHVLDLPFATQLLCGSWQRGEHIEDLPVACRPRDRAEGYAVQAGWTTGLGQAVAGWKIAATSVAGQRHINVAGPLAGPVFAHRVHDGNACIDLARNRMRVAECEIVFRLGRTLTPCSGGHDRATVLGAVTAVHPGIEIPDSRFLCFERAGEAQLIADCACTNDMVVGASIAADVRMEELLALEVRARVSDGRTPTDVGANVLGDPVDALVWLVNELGAHGITLHTGQFVTTGACVPPIPVRPGDSVEADFGWLGRLGTRFV